MSDVTLEVLTEAQAAELLRCAPSTIKSAIRERRIPSVRFGDESVIPVRALIDHLNQCALESVKTPTPPASAVTGVRVPEQRQRKKLPPPLVGIYGH